jgi:hypothetical protein
MGMVLIYNGQTVPVNISPEITACWDVGDVPVISIADSLCSSMHLNTAFSSLSHRGAHSVENLSFLGNLLTSFPNPLL